MSTPTATPPQTGASPARDRLAFAGVTAAGALGVGVLATLDPNRPGHYPTCPFLFLTGLWCPGCGSLRVVHDLAHLDLLGALDRNPLTVLLMPVVAYAWVGWLLRLTGRTVPRVGRAPAAVVWGFLALVLTFWVLRNMPGWTWLSPA